MSQLHNLSAQSRARIDAKLAELQQKTGQTWTLEVTKQPGGINGACLLEISIGGCIARPIALENNHERPADRQSTLRQVFENVESTKRQYALRQHAAALGWSQEQIIVIDSDLGQSGASAADREGFQRLVTEVGLGRAGIVLGLEVSRLARNSMDWHRL